MNFAALKAEVFRRLQEDSGSPVFWTEADVSAVLNEGLMELSDESEWYERTTTIDVLAGQRYYDLQTVLPSPLLTVGPVFNVTTNRWLDQVAPGDLDGNYRRWESNVGEAQQVLVRGLRWLGLYPVPNADSGELDLQYSALPDTLTEDGDEPGFPEPLHYGLVEYALAELWSQDAEVNKALAAWGAYLAYEARVRSWVQGRGAVPAVTVMGSMPSSGAVS